MRSLVTREPQSQSRQAAFTALSVRITPGAASGAKITLPQNRYMELGVPSPANRRRCTPPGIQNRHGAVTAATLTTITCNAQLGLKQLLQQRNPQEKVSRSPGGTPNKMDLVTESSQAALLIAPITTFLPNGSLRQQRQHLQPRPLPLRQQPPRLLLRPLQLPQQRCRPTVKILQPPRPQL